jgi:hypothetical protein
MHFPLPFTNGARTPDDPDIMSPVGIDYNFRVIWFQVPFLMDIYSLYLATSQKTIEFEGIDVSEKSVTWFKSRTLDFCDSAATGTVHAFQVMT